MKKPGNVVEERYTGHARNAIRRGKVVGGTTRPTNRPVESYNPRMSTSISSYTPVTDVGAESRNKNHGKALWGRPLWFSLHYGSLHYPDKVDSKMVNMTVGFIRGLPIMIPCDLCKNHAYEYISNFSDSQLHQVASDKRKLFKFYVDFHNSVNKRTGKAEMSLQDAYNLYEKSPETVL